MAVTLLKTPPILQFGTSRFLQAHVDLFVSEALARGEALGGIAVVQTTQSAESTARVVALKLASGYPIRVCGLQHGVAVDQTLQVNSVRTAWQADTEWARVREAVAGDVRVIVSNTADRGYQLDPADDVSLIDSPQRVPRSFPAKLLLLLHERWRRQPVAALSIFPCELVVRNGDTLRDLVLDLARQWDLPEDFLSYLRAHVVWANSLVDRIVSEALYPIGAVAEPYALWAIERQPRLVVPCSHPAIVLTDDLAHYERLKLFFLNLGHTILAERWLRDRRAADMTVVQAMADDLMRTELELVWASEVMPVFSALGQRAQAESYLVELRERLCNPFLAHRLADIANNHEAKKERRIVPIVALAKECRLNLAQPLLRAAMARHL